MISGKKLYVHLQFDGGIFFLREDLRASYVSKTKLIEEIGKLKETGGCLLYSRELAEGEPPGHIEEIFRCIESFHVPIQFVEPIKEVTTRPNDYVPPLIHAAYHGAIPWLEELIGWGVDLEVRDRFGQTALMMAADAGQLSAVKMLVEAGADVNALDHEGSTPLMFAAQHGYTDVAREIIRGGANVKTRGSHGFDARSLAAQNNHKDLVALLAKSWWQVVWFNIL